MTVRIAKQPVNIREKLAELERPIGINGQALLATDTPQQAFDLLGARNRNLIINGGMAISQRGTSFSPAATGIRYCLDKFYTQSISNNITITQSIFDFLIKKKSRTIKYENNIKLKKKYLKKLFLWTSFHDFFID